jgi:Bifunctional DNA primase/polymerase, N-terminal/AAA domain/Primase C terminal 1 (PriCT-1)
VSAADTADRAAVFVEHARRYAELGWVLVRLNGKVPRGRAWQQEKPGSPEFVAGQWGQWGRRFDMGVHLGGSGLAVVEDDSPEAHATLLELLGGELPPVPVCRSGGKSLHLYFADAGQGNATIDGLELRAGAQQCVVPPSTHPQTGRPYMWLEGHEPWVVPTAAIPEVLLTHFTGTLFAGTGPAAPVEEEIRQPGRHRALLSLAGSMRRRGMAAEEIAVALLAVNKSRCRPPLPERDVVELAADVGRRYEPAPPDPEQVRIGQEADRLLGEEPPQEEPRRRKRRETMPLIVSLVEFLGGDEDDAAWLVDHLAARAALVLVAGLPKVGKSTFVYGLLGALTSAAERFVGLPAGSTWVLLMTEEPAATVEEKVDRFSVDDERVFVISKRRMAGVRSWAKTVEEAVAFCRTHPEVGVCVVDTWDKFVGLSASRSEADTGVIVESIEPLYELLGLGVCVILITHQRKEEGDYGLRVRGGTALAGSADIIVEVERAGPAAGLSPSTRLIKIVSRFAGAPDAFAVELGEDEWRSLGPVQAAKRRTHRDQALAWLTEQPASFDEIQARAAGPSKNTVRRRLGELVRDGLAELTGEGVKGDPWRWQLSESGRLFVPAPNPGWDEFTENRVTMRPYSSHPAGGYGPPADGTQPPRERQEGEAQ